MNATHQLSFNLAELRFGDDGVALQSASTSLSAHRSRRCPQIRIDLERAVPSADSRLNLVIDKADNIRNKFVAVVKRFYRQIMLCEKLLSDFHSARRSWCPCSEHGVDGITSFAVFLCDIITASFGPSPFHSVANFFCSPTSVARSFPVNEVDSRNMTLSTIDF